MKFSIGQTVKIRNAYGINPKFQGVKGKVLSFWKRELPPLGKENEFCFVLELETTYHNEVYQNQSNIVSLHEYYLEAIPNI